MVRAVNDCDMELSFVKFGQLNAHCRLVTVMLLSSSFSELSLEFKWIGLRVSLSSNLLILNGILARSCNSLRQF